MFAQKARADVPPCGSAFQGHLRIKAPAVKRRTPATVRIALINSAGKALNDSATELALFPACPEAAEQTAYILGPPSGDSARTAKALGMRCRYKGAFRTGEVILVDDAACFEARKAEVMAAVEAGATLVLNALPLGTHDIAGAVLRVEACGMGERHFANRNTGHPIVEGVAPNDFKFLFDENCGYVTPFYDTCFFAKGFTPILTTGTGVSSGAWVPALAAAEKRHGKGMIRINQIPWLNRLSNPVINWYALRLFTLKT